MWILRLIITSVISNKISLKRAWKNTPRYLFQKLQHMSEDKYHMNSPLFLFSSCFSFDLFSFHSVHFLFTLCMATRNTEHGTRNTEHGTRNTQHATRNT